MRHSRARVSLSTVLIGAVGLPATTLGLAGCHAQEAMPESVESNVRLGEECPPRDLNCQLGQLDPIQRAQLDRLKSSAQSASVTVQGTVSGNVAALQYWDHNLSRWSVIHVYVHGPKQFQVYRSIFSDDGRQHTYFWKSVHPTDTAQNWQSSDYPLAARVMGRTLTDDLRAKLDGAAAKALGSEQGQAGFLAARTSRDIPINAARACNSTCFDAAASFAVVIGVVSTLACGIFVANKAVACGLAGVYLGFKLVSTDDCFGRCTDCYSQLENSCRSGPVVPRGCFSMPFRCQGSTVVVTQRI